MTRIKTIKTIDSIDDLREFILNVYSPTQKSHDLVGTMISEGLFVLAGTRLVADKVLSIDNHRELTNLLKRVSNRVELVKFELCEFLRDRDWAHCAQCNEIINNTDDCFFECDACGEYGAHIFSVHKSRLKEGWNEFSSAFDLLKPADIAKISKKLSMDREVYSWDIFHMDETKHSVVLHLRVKFKIEDIEEPQCTH